MLERESTRVRPDRLSKKAQQGRIVATRWTGRLARVIAVATILSSSFISLEAVALPVDECEQPKGGLLAPAGCNVPPRVGIIVSAEKLVAPGTVHIAVSAVSYGGDFSSLSIYSNQGTLVSVSGQELVPYNSGGLLDYEYTWSNVPAGTYQIWAGVQSNMGSISDKEVITVTPSGDVPPPPPPSPPLTLLLTRQYVYDGKQQLCKVIEPETGATVYDYDNAGNLAWSAAGLHLPDPANCNRPEAYASDRVVLRSYDARSRLVDLSFPDGLGDQHWTYTPDGLPEEVTTQNGPYAFSDLTTNGYAYNRRRMLQRESRTQRYEEAGIEYRYDAIGSLSTLVYPSGMAIDYAPNALGQPTRASTYATNVRYYPGGAIASYTYGNGVTHSVTLNGRQLTGRRTDSGGILDLGYVYDGSGNVTAIDDYGRGNAFRRSMTYDGLDRLLAATSPMFGGNGIWTYKYDGLDNIRIAALGGVQDHAYWYDATNRLTNIKNAAGATVIGLGYDSQGNVTNKNGAVFDFDYGNRLRGSGASIVTDTEYWYDAYGRRSWMGRPGGLPGLDGSSTLYTFDGRLLTRSDGDAWKNAEYVYLGNELITKVDTVDFETTVTYEHADALGSLAVESSGGTTCPAAYGAPVAMCGAGAVLAHTDYQPYGAVIGSALNGVGFTGHLMDKATGLSYMQQRYYDPVFGRMLSRDPVTAFSSGDVRLFNAYAYGFNNPYRFNDPDGREAACANTGCGIDDAKFHNVVEGTKAFLGRFWTSVDSGIFHTAGQAIAADAAYVKGVATRDDALQSTAIEGMRENVTAQDGVAAAMMSVSPRAGKGPPATAIEIVPGATRASPPQITASMSVADARANLTKAGYTWKGSSTMPGAGTMSKGNVTYKFSPVSNSTGMPSAKVTVGELRTANIRFKEP